MASQRPDREDRLTPRNLCNPGSRDMTGESREEGNSNPWTMRGSAAWACSHNGGMLTRSILLADQHYAYRGGFIAWHRASPRSAQIASHIPGLWRRGWPPIPGICTPALDPSVPGCYGSSGRIARFSPLVYCLSAAAWSPEEATCITTSPSTKPICLPYSAKLALQPARDRRAATRNLVQPPCQQESLPTLWRHD
jgi:hypothetical protein